MPATYESATAESVTVPTAPISSPRRTRFPIPRTPMTLLTALSLLILALGAVEDIYGNTDSGDVYGSDAVQYLDIARAMVRHDWHSALNPLWSQGYPALLALFRPLLAAGPGGDWWTTRAVNYLIFTASYAAFLFLLLTVLPYPTAAKLPGYPTAAELPGQKRWLQRAEACLLLFAALQTCLGQVSRVNPDELVTACFLFACTQIVRLLRAGASPWRPAVLLGFTLALGFLVKAAFLGLGCDMLAVTGIGCWGKRIRLRPVVLAAAIFAFTVGAYGSALSHAAGYKTLGDSGAINYAWHVNRLQKWVHWQGGVQPAEQAWPKPLIARFAQWTTRPPDFGMPIHPGRILQESPRVYGFQAPVHATYVPYFDPPYFYQGYRDIFRVRYQLIALFKSGGDLLAIFGKQPILLALLLGLLVPLRGQAERRGFVKAIQRQWALIVCAALGIALYLPVHLEGRYIVGMLLVLGLCAVSAATQSAGRPGRFTAILLLGFLAEAGLYQVPVWRNLARHKLPAQNTEWRMGVAAAGENLPPGAPVAVIAWTPNLHCDWAYISHLQITSEIASGPDYDQFWHLPADRQAATLATFRQAGDLAVFVNGKPPGLGGPEWRPLGGTTLWMARLR